MIFPRKMLHIKFKNTKARVFHPQARSARRVYKLLCCSLVVLGFSVFLKKTRLDEMSHSSIVNNVSTFVDNLLTFVDMLNVTASGLMMKRMFRLVSGI